MADSDTSHLFHGPGLELDSLSMLDLHGELVASDNEEEEAVQYTA